MWHRFSTAGNPINCKWVTFFEMVPILPSRELVECGYIDMLVVAISVTFNRTW